MGKVIEFPTGIEAAALPPALQPVVQALAEVVAIIRQAAVEFGDVDGLDALDAIAYGVLAGLYDGADGMHTTAAAELVARLGSDGLQRAVFAHLADIEGEAAAGDGDH